MKRIIFPVSVRGRLGRNTVTAHKIDVFSGCTINGLRLCLEFSFLVLEVNVRAHRCNPVRNPDSDQVIVQSGSARLYAQNIQTYSSQKTAFGPVCQTDIAFRSTGVLDILGRGTVRSCRKILHLPDSRG